jgi:hypothetical protein
MPSRRRYSPDKLDIQPAGERPATWTFTRDAVSGTEFRYAVTDGNFESRNGWEFVVRVPKDRGDRIEVRPQIVPNLKAWARLERRSLTFARATKTGYTGRVYCQVALADTTGERTKDVARTDERADLPRWFDAFRTRLRAKGTVRATKGHDEDQLVAVVDKDDHAAMIALFFATKVWVLKEKFALPVALA